MKPCSVSRRSLLRTAAAAPLAAGAGGGAARAALPPAPYTVSINIEIMFPRTMPRPERMRMVAARGFKAFSFWTASDAEQDAMLKVMQATGLKCASISGNPRFGRTTGLTKPGEEKPFLDEITQYVKAAHKFGGADPIIFPGALQKDIPWAQQEAGIISGLKKAGDIAKEYGIVLTLEPEDLYEAPTISIWSCRQAFPIIEAVGHSNVKICFDMYHLQLAEGDLTNHLRTGLQKRWIKLVQIGDVPGRKEPGTGEVNWAHVFRVLRAEGYTGYVDTEHGTTSTPEHAMDVVKQLSLEN